MNVLMVTPHLPPHQAANALLPHYLGTSLAERGHTVRYLAFGEGAGPRGVRFIRRRSRRLGSIKLPQLLEATEAWWKAWDWVREADVVHVHSNTWVNQVLARLAERQAKPYLLTHYGTEIWHHDGKNRAFRRLNREARHVTFYSRTLLARARELTVPTRAASVVYPPVSDGFQPMEPAARAAERQRLGVSGRLVLNVKRLHPLADQATLLSAMAPVLSQRPDTTLLIAGTGESELALRAQADQLGLAGAVRFLGQVPNREVAQLQGAADLFVLSSLLEATPTVALEALACGTPVVSTDNPGGLELGEIFGGDVTVVPKQDPRALAAAILSALASPRRTRPTTALTLGDQFRLAGVVDRYLRLYEEIRQV